MSAHQSAGCIAQVSFEKLKQIWVQAKEQVAAEKRARAAATASGRKLNAAAADHAFFLREHFSDAAAIVLAKMHHPANKGTADAKAATGDGSLKYTNPLAEKG